MVPGSDLERWLPAAQAAVSTRHVRTATGVGADALWAAAQAVRLSDTRRLGRLVGWRIPGLRSGLAYHELFSEPPFCVLDRGAHALVSGLVGRIWTLARDYPPLAGPAGFAAWAEPGTVRVAFAHRAEPCPGGARLISEARVAPVDGAAERRLRMVWALVGPFERLVGAEPLALAVERAGG